MKQGIHLLPKMIISKFQTKISFRKCLEGIMKCTTVILVMKKTLILQKELHLTPLYLTQVPHILAHKNV